MRSPADPPARAAARRQGALVVAVAAATVLALAPVVRPPPPPSGTAMVGQAPGSCHLLAVAEEHYLVSDARPPVSCRRPHTAETIGRHRLPEAVADRRARPSLERLAVLARMLRCGPAQVHEYLGGNGVDPHWFVDVVVRFPTADEWRAGERRYRCDAQVARPDGRPRLRRGSLRGILRTPAGAAVRPCIAGVRLVPCSTPHDREVVATGAPAVACPTLAGRFVGAAVAPGVVATVVDLGDGILRCTVRASAGRGAVRGTLAAAARRSPP